MLYASELYRELGSRNGVTEELPDHLPDLIARILLSAVSERLRQSLTTGYRARHAELTRLRGKIDIVATERRQLLLRGRIACRFDELTVDTARNRLALAALLSIAGQVSSRDLSHSCQSAARRLQEQGVTNWPPHLLRGQLTERLNRNDAPDLRMIAAARLALDLALPTEDTGDDRLPMPAREEVWVRRLFEKAVAGFYKVHLEGQDCRVSPGQPLQWQIGDKSESIDAILPSMRTDIIVDHEGGRRVVIDTKFTSIVTGGWHREETLRSGYLYQIYSYIRSQEGMDGHAWDSAEGLLLHPSIDADVDEFVVIQGHRIRFATVDLSSTNACIQKQLLRAISAQ